MASWWIRLAIASGGIRPRRSIDARKKKPSHQGERTSIHEPGMPKLDLHRARRNPNSITPNVRKGQRRAFLVLGEVQRFSTVGKSTVPRGSHTGRIRVVDGKA